MKTRILLSIGVSALVVTGGLAGVAFPGMIATAAGTENPKRAASEAANARKALAKRDANKAIKFAESAVAYSPQNAEYRALLGQAYLLAGRFASARTALGDSLTLDPSDGRVALNYALAQIAQGDWAGARATLDRNEGIINASDRGLAYALAGDPVKAVDILVPAVRAADATAKTRQNYALSLALAGRWQEARNIAAMDVPADQLDARIMQWAAFSRPTNAYDQVASLLGVRAVEDQGQPTGLALVMPGNVGVAAVQPKAADPVDAYMPGVPENAPQVVAEVQADTGVPIEAPVTQVAGTGPQVVFGPREEIVQAVPASAPRRSVTPARPAPVRLASAPAPARTSYAKGSWVVQLGAYENSAVARDAWRRTSARVPALAHQTPKGASFSNRGESYYRLSVGGFARADADSLCRTVRSTGGNCFVRAQSGGDQVASWINPRRTVQMASR
ncbi:tetratricopeptide repeat protein [Sphingomonas sp. AOB5]|uniref:SPOR domain-containing protein n=1 Tax=Sphingomonas sp. AOB5 TaxID=3034017 RepID=UPI0023F79588|nr:tetratricopeptide repeat protein [Sphingomonas sp. AOB5]MDF7774373.1 tetratricopeptide repeat protein [Sphingomonas sp. AOB5]